MPDIQLTKALVLEALTTETSFGYNQWIQPDHLGLISDPACPVCAVGAVLRRVLEPTLGSRRLITAANAATLGANVAGVDIALLLELKAYLNALSCFYEDLVDSYCRNVENFKVDRYEYGTVPEAAVEVLRPQLLAFVAKHFPDAPFFVCVKDVPAAAGLVTRANVYDDPNAEGS